MKSFKYLFAVTIITYVLTSCEPEPTPTHQLMQGVWQMDQAYNENDSVITESVNSFFPTYIHLDDNNSVNSTAGPMFMYVVYGGSKFVSIVSKLDQAFAYTDLKITEGEFFMVKDEVTDRFTIEIKMKFLTMESLTTLLEIMGINPPSLLEEVIYHKFVNVNVIVDEENPEQMIWEFDEQTEAIYNIKDQYGNYVAWYGIPWENFTKGRFVFTKKSKSLTELVQESS